MHAFHAFILSSLFQVMLEHQLHGIVPSPRFCFSSHGMFAAATDPACSHRFRLATIHSGHNFLGFFTKPEFWLMFLAKWESLPDPSVSLE